MRPYTKVKVTVPMIHRMDALREAKLSYNAIAAVMRLDYEGDFNEYHVRYYLRNYAPGYRRSPRGRPFEGKAAA